MRIHCTTSASACHIVYAFDGQRSDDGYAHADH
jgi:hypothetical protein